MNQIKTGSFLKQLRKEKGLTQEQLAEEFNVSGRTISRWENGNNMPDLSILVELSEFYDVDIREIIDGERKKENMNEEMKDTLEKVADYSSMEKEKIMRKTHIFAWIGVIGFIAYEIMDMCGISSDGMGKNISSFILGACFGIMIIMVIDTGRNIIKISNFKKRLFNRK